MNMALDEALLEHVGDGKVPPTLRFYQWSPPTISLGYFQSYVEYEGLPSPAGDLAVTRRLTGGGAILHDEELTYSLALPAGHPLPAAGTTSLYGTMHAAISAGLERFGVAVSRRGECDEDSFRRGPFFCFSREHREDLVLGTGKIVGSAQRRTRLGVLQHGSIILGSRFGQQECATAGLETSDNLVRDLCTIIGESLMKKTALSLSPASWTDAELRRADELRVKYESDEWVRMR